jgi:hypothetical protein
MNTIVSAFVSNINNRYDNTLNRYYNYGRILLKSTTPKIIFVDEIMFELIQERDFNKNDTLIVKINKKTSYLYSYAQQLTKFHLNSTDYTKDTIEFIFTMCNKTEWVKEAIMLNHFKTEHFIWLDFGIKYIFQGLSADEEFIEKINGLKYKTYNNIRIGCIWNLNNKFNIDIYKDVAWYFAGGLFGGNNFFLLKFAKLMKEKCIEIMTTKNTIMWEVNIWYLIYKENKLLFDGYGCNHDKSLIDNY